MSRRDVLKGGITAAGALAAGAVLGACGGSGPKTSATVLQGSGRYRWPVPVARRKPGSRPFPDRAAGTDTMPEIEHVVVLMMENHSYDNYLGMLGRGDGFTLGADGKPTNWNPTADGRRQLAFAMPDDCQQDGHPSQEWTASHEQYDGGTNMGFVTSASGPVAMGYWTSRDLAFYYSLASTFPLADRWFSSLLGQTYPNRRYLTAATSAGMVDDVVSQVLSSTAPQGTIFDVLDAHDVSWRNYYHLGSLPTIDVWYGDRAARSANVVSVDAFFADAASGRLPGFAIVDPDFGSGSEEDPQNISVGQSFSSREVTAVMEGPAWSKTLLVWTYDEHGGYYDHVPPPPALAPDSLEALSPVGPHGEKAYDGFRRYGFRVPAVVVSPYGRKDHVTHTVHDHTSILAMVERKWNLPALTFRDANAADLMDFLDLSRPTWSEPPALAAPLSAGQGCSPGHAGTIPPPGSVVA